MRDYSVININCLTLVMARHLLHVGSYKVSAVIRNCIWPIKAKYWYWYFDLDFHWTDVDTPSGKRQLCGGSQAAIEKMLLFGRDLQSMSQRLKREYGKSESNNKSLQVGILCNNMWLSFFTTQNMHGTENFSL